MDEPSVGGTAVVDTAWHPMVSFFPLVRNIVDLVDVLAELELLVEGGGDCRAARPGCPDAACGDQIPTELDPDLLLLESHCSEDPRDGIGLLVALLLLVSGRLRSVVLER